MLAQHYLDDVRIQFAKLKELADKAMAQIDDKAFFAAPDREVSNSIAITVKHMAGNMRSRWTSFLTTDGEKPDRHRDTEFEWYESDSRQSLMLRWEQGWGILNQALESLTESDLMKSVTIRSESHTVIEAINRQMTHYAYHIGQIVYLARHYAGPNWKSLSIPKGMSKEFEVNKRAEVESVSKKTE